MADVFHYVASCGLSIHGYADDMQIYDHCHPDDTALLMARLCTCIEGIHSWMSRNRLKLNSSKTEFIWLGSARRLLSRAPVPLRIGTENIQPLAMIHDLGVILDSTLSLSSQVSRLVSTSYYHIRQLRSIRHSLTADSCHALVRALVLSRLDYCNGLLSGISSFLLDKLSGVLRSAARLVLKLPRRSHITQVMRSELHWLDVPARITFKLCVLVYRCLHGSAPPYLAKFCVPVSAVEHRARLRSSTQGLLLVPPTKTVTMGDRAFAISGPSAWNSLPSELRNHGLSLLTFRKKLKTHLFNRTF